MIERTAFSCIGWDDGEFIVKGGRVRWQAVMYNCANGGRMVKLARIIPVKVPEPGQPLLSGLREVSRYVEPETVLVFPDSAKPVFEELFPA